MIWLQLRLCEKVRAAGGGMGIELLKYCTRIILCKENDLDLNLVIQ